MRRMTRRALLLGGALAALGGGLRLWRSRRGAARRAARMALVSELYSDPPALRRIGARVLRDRPAWRDEGVLERSWLDREPLGHEPRRALVGRVREDYAEGRVLQVDGWVISESEAGLFALLALERQRR